jgi:hypothetical protein
MGTICLCFIENRARFLLRDPKHYYWCVLPTACLPVDFSVPCRAVCTNWLILMSGIQTFLWYLVEKFNLCSGNASCCVPFASQKLISCGIDYGTMASGSRAVARLTIELRTSTQFPTHAWLVTSSSTLFASLESKWGCLGFLGYTHTHTHTHTHTVIKIKISIRKPKENKLWLY